MMALWITSIALLCLVGALWLFQVAARKQRAQGVSQYVEERLERQRMDKAPEATAEEGLPTLPAASGMRDGWNNILLRAGIQSSEAFSFRVVLVGGVLVACAALWLGPLSATVLMVCLMAGLAFYLWMRMEKRRRRMIDQLPDFLETMVRLITIGNGMGAAFQTASAGVHPPLQDLLERAHQLNRVGVEIDAALHQVARLYRFQELELVAAVVGVALRFGGRSDQVLERMAGFMRDLQQARQELFALSAEVRLSAWILALLPVGVAGIILIMNNDLFMTMWEDPMGRTLLFVAVGLQAAGSFLLYKMAKSV